MSVSILPPSPAFGGLGAYNNTTSEVARQRTTVSQADEARLHAAMQNGVSRSHDELSVAEIKERAKGHAQRVTRGASAISLIKGARSQILIAQTHEADGELKDAYSAYIKAVSLLQTFIDSVEFKGEARLGSKGVLSREFQELQQVRHWFQSMACSVLWTENSVKAGISVRGRRH
jgi:hypothetical protein